MAKAENNDNEQYIYCKYIIVKGVKRYPKNASVFKIPLSKLKKSKD